MLEFKKIYVALKFNSKIRLMQYSYHGCTSTKNILSSSYLCRYL